MEASPRLATPPSGGDGSGWHALTAGERGNQSALDVLGLSDTVRASLLAEPGDAAESKDRPPVRFRRERDGAVFGLTVPGGDQSDAAPPRAVALWIDAERIVTVENGAVPWLDETVERHRSGPASPTEVLSAVLCEIGEALDAELAPLSGALGELEDRLAHDPAALPLDDLAALRHRMTRLRRQAAPLEVVAQAAASARWLPRDHPGRCALEDGAQSVERQHAALRLLLERSHVLQEQIQAELADRMNRATYRLGVVATVFLPLGFLTGLLGINVAGIPGDHDPHAFWLVCGMLLVIAVGWTALVARAERF